ncbi:hypothetical protein Clacol_009991 [Clathrus columnatus]|uniref:non-specific serine/threonine protein kinase n=1 Tax=Clathrus columnatus TaxID=1419009 RepID=A0AAV5ARS7_9AGAM|nr:hypothetical protein Clacol_009991 [Clathrus columnatus]
MVLQSLVALCQPRFTKSLMDLPSPPPTPEPEAPLRQKKWRFDRDASRLFCEWCEMYRPGGFHPVNLGDKFRDGTYTVIRKLGSGSYSTVWLAVDSSIKRYVALKIFTAKASVSETELGIIQFLSQKANIDNRSQYIITLLDTFIHQGPNGTHRCLVFEPMGPSAESLARQLPESRQKPFQTIPRFPKSMAKRIFLHTLHGLAFLHENGIVHGDIQPGNFLFSLNDITNVEEDELRQDETIPRSFAPLRRRDGKQDKWSPNNIYLGQPLQQYTPLGSDMKVKLSDLGSAFWANNPPTKHSSPIALRAPELILGKHIGPPIDIWAFGCLVFEFLTGKTLFLVIRDSDSQRDRNEMDDDHLLQFNDIIEKLPSTLLNDWPRANKWFHPVTHHPRKKPRLYREDKCPYDSLEVMFAQHKPDDIDEAESTLICSLIRQILVYAPEERPSATEILKHPYFLE